jgi:hypothetical protein
MHILYIIGKNHIYIYSDTGGSESEDAELSDCTLMVQDYLEQADQRKIGKES